MGDGGHEKSADESSWIKNYMELTGATESEARNAFMYLGSAGKREGNSNQPTAPPTPPASPAGSAPQPAAPAGTGEAAPPEKEAARDRPTGAQ